MASSRIPKLYFSIREVCDRYGLEPHVLRYWESEFTGLKPRKNRSGRRVYTREEVQLVGQIYQLLRVDKYTLEGARQVLTGKVEKQEAHLREELREMRAFLSTLLETL